MSQLDQYNQKEQTGIISNIATQLRNTSTKFKAIGAGLQVFLKAIDRITFSAQPVHVPDQQLIDEVVRLLSGERTSKHD